jgi:hypothetical protein
VIETLQHARRQLVAALSRVDHPSLDQQFIAADAMAKIDTALSTGKSYAAAIAATAQAICELQGRR